VIGPRSLRGRVTVAATVAVAIVLAVAGILTVATFASNERNSVDRDLERRAEGALRRFGPRGDEPLPIERPAPPPPLSAGSGDFTRVISPGGRVAIQAGDVPSEGFPLTEPGFATIRAGGGRWRVLTVEGDGPGPPGARLQLATDLEPTEDRIASLRTRVIVVAVGGILVAALVSRWIAALALQPLSRLREAVAGVTTTRDLSRRLPVEGEGTETDELAASVNAMLARLEGSAGELEQALEATRRFAADVGHEIRTPLTSIRANFDSLARNPDMPEDERRTVLAELAAQQGELVGLLDALQALARGDAAGALPRGELDLAETVDAAVEAACRRHPHARFDLRAPDARLPVVGWPDGIRLLVDNLLENAARHGGEKVRVELAPVADQVAFTVEDDGPGVPPEDRERIFDRFARGARATGPGSGLGLALVKQQAELHGGSVEVDGSPLGGARFAVSLPRAEAPQQV